MAEIKHTHQPQISIVQSVPSEVDAGVDVELRVGVTCPSGCHLQGRPVRIMAPDGVVATSELIETDEHTTEASIILRAPVELGEYRWSAVFPRHEGEGVVHEERMIPFSFTVRPHQMNLAVWDVPLPATIGSPFRIKVGVKCSAGCRFSGQPIEIRNEDGETAASGTLGDTLWPNTTALYWGEVGIVAPALDKVHRWSVHLPASALKLPHVSASSGFSFRTAPLPDHTVTVEIVDKNSQAPIRGADVSLNVFKGMTDEGGVARVPVPKGTYDLCVAGNDYFTYQRPIEVNEDLNLRIELIALPPEVGY